MAEAYDLRRWVLKALDDGNVGAPGDIRTHCPGASRTPLTEIEAVLLQLEDEGLAVFSGGAWRSATRDTHLAGSAGDHGAQRRALVYIPSYDSTTYFHLSYWEGLGNYRLRRYVSGRPVEAFTVDGADTVDELRAMHPFASEHPWSATEAKNVDQVEFWAREIAQLNRGLAGHKDERMP